MTAAPQRRSRARELFDQALEQAADARPAFLARACAGDAVLRGELDSLLALHGDAQELLREPTLPATEAPGDRIGHYQLLQQIGEGGFGTVWMAEQKEPVRRKVALKVLKAGMDTAQVIGRFEAERQALAMMDHPNIAKVFDGGATPTGRPYFVMELVKGVPITKYCDEAGLDMAERLELFVPVCQAVQHAHQKGVIHRDLKPSNVMVTLHDGRPVPKVIDFGIAKATQGRLTDKTVFTEFRQMLGTPEYMAPEQAELSGLDVDTRADIYSLGVLLYELLTGTRPFELRTLLQAGYAEMVRTIKEVDPPKPSTRVSTLGEQMADIARHRRVHPRTFGALMRGDLDWIVMKALEKERSRRYDTATALAEDVLRHLHHEPVLAGQPSRTYRLRKYMRRHRVGVAAGSAITAALVLGAIAAALGFVEAQEQTRVARYAEAQAKDEKTAAVLARADERAQRSRAEEREAAATREAAKNQHLVNLLKEMLGTSDPYRSKGKDYTVRQLLDDFDRDLGNQLAAEPEVEMGVRQTLSLSYLGLGLPDRAKPHLERAQALLAAGSGLDPFEAVRVADLQARYLKDTGRHAEAMHAYAALVEHHAGEVSDRETVDRWRCHQSACASSLGDPSTAIRILESLAADLEQRDGDQRLGLARVQQFLSVALGRRRNPGDLARCERMARKALDTQRKLLPANAPEISASIGNLAEALHEMGHIDDASGLFAEMLQRDIDHYGPTHVWVATSKAMLANSLWALGQLDRAEQLLLEAVATHRSQPSEPMNLASALKDLGNVYFTQKRYADAVGLYSEALATSQRELGDDNDLAATSLLNLARTQQRLGNGQAARQLLDKSLAMRIRLHGRDHLEVSRAQTMLGGALMASAEFEAAEKVLQAAAATQRRDLPAVHPQLASTLSQLAESLLRQGKDADAARCAEEALVAGRPFWPPPSPSLINTLALLGAARWQLGELAASAAAFEEVVGIQSQFLGAQHRQTVMTQFLLVRVLLDQGADRAAEAEHLAEGLLAAKVSGSRADDPEFAPLLLLRAEARLLAGRVAEAEADLQQAVGICRQVKERNIPFARAQSYCGDYLLARGRAAEAEPLLRESLELLARQDPTSPARWIVASQLGGVLVQLARYAEAEPLLLQARERIPVVMPQPHGRARRQTLQRLVELYERWGKPDQAVPWREKLLQLRSRG